MSDPSNALEEQVERMILSGFAQPGDDQPEADAQDETARPIFDVDLYRLDGGAILLIPNSATNPLEANAVESAAPAQETPQTPAPEDDQQAEQELPQEEAESALPAKQRRGRRPYILLSLVLLCIVVAGLLAGAASYVYLLPMTARATVTLTPEARSLQTKTTLTIAAHPKAGQVQGRPLEPVSLTKSQTVPATGHGHDDARAATGVMTFYNADSTPLTIPAGITFTPQDGVTIVTDSAVTVQAAIPPTFGIAIVAAHVIQAGSAGNIAAHAIYIRCCGSQFLTATNTGPFTGGQDARTYSFIQTSDIRHAANDLLTGLTQEATTALTKQARPGEQLVTPLCSPHTASSQPAGSEGAEVTISVTQQCTSVVYQTDSLNQVATSTLAKTANLTSYQQEGTVQATINGSTYTNQTASLNVSLAGVWVYHFSQAQLRQLTQSIAGKSQGQAKATLERGEGIASVTIHLSRLDARDQLPTNPQRITIQFFYIVS